MGIDSHMQLLVIVGNIINRFVSITTKTGYNLRKSIKIDSKRKCGRFVSISIDTTDDNCIKLISIDKKYGMFTFSILIDFEQLKLPK